MRRLIGLVLTLLLLVPATAGAETVPALREIILRVNPSVLSLTVVKQEPAVDEDLPPRTVVAEGSGFVIRDGYLLTNAHVLDHALAVRVADHAGHAYAVDPDQIWADPVSDLAVAHLDADLPPVAWADLTQVQLGDPVFAIGSPYGSRFRGSVSRGIVSGFERSLGGDYTFIQTDAPINPGNSGGPLFNQAGEVVGVNARAIFGADGMGFAIPGDVAQEIADRLIRDGRIDRAWLGLQLQESWEADLSWSLTDGPVVTAVEESGAARESGIQVGDSLVRVNGTLVRTLEDVGTELRKLVPGMPVTVAYRRGEVEHSGRVVLSVRPHDAQLYRHAGGVWANLTPAQQQRARLYGRQWAYLDAEVMEDPWTVHSAGARAVLVTEYLSLARLSREAVRADRRLTPEALSRESAKRRGILEVQVDLPGRYPLDAEKLWAQWRDGAGSVRAFQVEVLDNAPPGYQRVVVRVRSAMIETDGFGQLILHLDEWTERHFFFALDQIH